MAYPSEKTQEGNQIQDGAGGGIPRRFQVAFAFYLGKRLLRVKPIIARSRGSRFFLVGVASFDAGVRSVVSLQLSRRCANCSANRSVIIVIFVPDGQLLSVMGYPVGVFG